MQKPFPQEDYCVKEISPRLGGGGTYDLVEQMEYLFVRIMKARNLSPEDITTTGSCNPYVDVRLGNYRGTTSHLEQVTNPEWNQVFVLSSDQIQASTIEVAVKDKHVVNDDDFIGMVKINLNQILRRFGWEGARWYRLKDPRRKKVNAELSLTAWIGTQMDGAFPEANHLGAESTVSGGSLVNTGSKEYHSPKLWYLRVNVIEAQDLQVDLKPGYPEVFVRAMIGNQALRTRISECRNENPCWNEDFIFVVAEPFEQPLVISVEERFGLNKDKVLGKTLIYVQNVERRLGNEEVVAEWYNLEKHVVIEEGDQKKKEAKYASQISLRISLDGGYHVLDAVPHYSSDLRPSAKRLWKPSIGVLELGILGALGLQPMKTRKEQGTTDAYCVAKYGHKWVRTRTVIDSFSPRWNEQYSWEVYDPDTILTVGVFDDPHLLQQGRMMMARNKDSRIGKVRIRLSTLETGRVYTHSYPLLVLQPSGLKKMGEIRLAVRFNCSSMLRMMHTYTQPLLPKMHYLRPLSAMQQDSLRSQAIQIISMRLSREEPLLKKEVVEYMMDGNSHMWNIRRSKAILFRIMGALDFFTEALRWFDHIRSWKNPWTTVVIHLVFVVLVLHPELVLPAVFLCLFLVSVRDRRFGPRHPPHMNARLSHAEFTHPDELDEEFDTFPTSRPADLVRMRYDRLRTIAGRVQTIAADVAAHVERLQSLRSGRDPRATNLFTVFCLLLAILLYFRPRIVALLAGFFVMRHPRFRHPLPAVLLNFFQRLPSKEDMLF